MLLTSLHLREPAMGKGNYLLPYFNVYFIFCLVIKLFWEWLTSKMLFLSLEKSKACHPSLWVPNGPDRNNHCCSFHKSRLLSLWWQHCNQNIQSWAKKMPFYILLSVSVVIILDTNHGTYQEQEKIVGNWKWSKQICKAFWFCRSSSIHSIKFILEHLYLSFSTAYVFPQIMSRYLYY